MKRKLAIIFSAAILFLRFGFFALTEQYSSKTVLIVCMEKMFIKSEFLQFQFINTQLTNTLQLPKELHPGIDWMTGDDWYDNKARAIVKEMVKTNPSLRDEFSNRVLKNHDWKYLKAFVQRVVTLKDGKPNVSNKL